MCLDHRPLHTSKKATSLQLFSEARTVVALIDRTRSLVSSGCTIFAASSGTVQSTEKANSMHYLEVHTWNDLNDIVELPAKGNTEAHNRARACVYTTIMHFTWTVILNFPPPRRMSTIPLIARVSLR